MKQQYLIGVDLGTSATKAALYELHGKLIAQAVVEVPIRYPKPGEVEQNLEDFHVTAATTVRQVLADAGIQSDEVAAIAFDSQMAGVGLIDEEFRPVGHFDSWLDMRCQPFIELLTRRPASASRS